MGELIKGDVLIHGGTSSYYPKGGRWTVSRPRYVNYPRKTKFIDLVCRRTKMTLDVKSSDKWSEFSRVQVKIQRSQWAPSSDPSPEVRRAPRPVQAQQVPQSPEVTANSNYKSKWTGYKSSHGRRRRLAGWKPSHDIPRRRY